MSVDLSSLISMMGGVQGIDWAELERRGKNDIFMPEYILEYVLPAYGRALKVFNTIDFMPETDAELVDRYAQMSESIKDPLSFAQRAFSHGVSMLLPGEGFSISDAEMRSFVYYVWLTVTNGAYLHNKVIIHYAVAREDGGQLSDAGVQRIADHAEWVVTMCNTVVTLNERGVFNKIKKPGFAGTPYVSTNGMGMVHQGAMGALPLAIVVIIGIGVVIVAVAAIAALAYMLLGIKFVTEREKTLRELCGGPLDSNDVKVCQELAKNSKMPPPPGSGFGLDKVAWIIGLAAAGYALILFGPVIAQSLKSRQASKATA